MVDIATEEYPKIKSSAIEFDLPQPNYTVHTLGCFRRKVSKAYILFDHGGRQP